MARLPVLLILTFALYANASSVNLILTDGAFGGTIVDAVVARISQTCIFSDDKRFLRRLAFVESRDGTDAVFNAGNSGGIWLVSTSMFNNLGSSLVANLKVQITQEFGIDWNSVTYADLAKPLYSALAVALYSEFIVQVTPLTEIPISISDQADLWVDHFKSGESAQTYITRANEYEDSQASCNVGADIVIVMDESGSIGSVDYQKQKDFVAQVIDNLVIGPTANQVGIITYATTADIDIKLDGYSNKQALKNAVLNLGYIGGATFTHVALSLLVTDAFTALNGARPESQGHPRVGIVLTDGGSNLPAATQIEATNVRDEGIILFTVGVGTRVNTRELEGMASEPTCLHYYQLNGGFSEILDLVNAITAATCQVPISFYPNGTLVKPVEPNFPYNCEIEVAPQGTTIQISSTTGNLTFFLSNVTYPSPAFYDSKILVNYGNTAVVFIPPGAGNQDNTVFCSFSTNGNGNVTVVTISGKPTYNCALGNSPCTAGNIAAGKFYFPHDSPNRFVQCGGIGICYDMWCPAGLVWYQDILTCNYPPTPNVPPPISTVPTYPPTPTGFTCTPPNPCSVQNTQINGYYYPHVHPRKFIQCDAFGGCFEMPCAPGTKWNNAVKTCTHG